ncbi:MAG: hypothetical protein ACI8UO_002048 [Verrucomicrobiales bacterium]
MDRLGEENQLQRLALDFLSELERAEAELICWGFTGSALGEDELRRHAESFLESREQADFSSEQLLAFLRTRKLLFDLAGGARTRMAETMRLLARLKLLVPKRMQKLAWLASPDLVNDYRLSIGPRARPRRDLDPDTAVKSLPLGERGMRAASLLASRFQLSGFQVRATERLLESAQQGETTGTIICAGTGSGKTLAFYLPALSSIVDSIDGTYWTKVLAIYPRTELLKDQFQEAVRAARSLSAELGSRRGGRLLRIGAIYGDAPKSSKRLKWRKATYGRICPYLRCPDCDGELIWLETEIQAGRESLSCPICRDALRGVDIGLTRHELTRRPPDILFVTSEILNQRMADSEIAPLLGVDVKPERRPRFVLLDEVHTYVGVAGAQFAMLLRRWLKRSGAKPTIAGLSATLGEPGRFFAELTGLPRDSITEISPTDDELEYEGAEYQLALRGSPVSNASLLSTTIQTAMLLGRMLDKLGNSVSDHVFGAKSFIFTDDLDVTNRLLFNLLDSEGRNPSTGNLIQGRVPLASLRGSDQPNAVERDENGQLWAASEQIGHALSGEDLDALRIDRVSSQDPGLNADSEVVVATASLEVGYNDLDAGAIIQHKAPRDAAVFVQRKGRAGRRSICRPWTIVVLSDWGKDRQAFQGFDLLFSPQLRPRELPFRNRYVLKMQACYAMIDWLGLKFDELGGVPAGSAWLDLCAPARNESQARRQQLLAGIFRNLLTDEAEQAEFTAYLAEALRICPTEVGSLLREAPRSIFGAAIPTAIRRLETQWAFRGEVGKDLQAPNSPLPEFITANLFSELATPEVLIHLPDYLGEPRGPHRMPVLQAMREFAPGRVSRRFSIGSAQERHWIPIEQDDEAESEFSVDSILAEEHRDVLGTFELTDENGLRFKAECSRPHCFQPVLASKSVSDSCNSVLAWSSEMVPPLVGSKRFEPLPKCWSGLVRESEFYLHARQAPLEVRRFAYGAKASFRGEDGANRHKRIHFVNAGETKSRRALGFILDVDALRTRLAVPRLSKQLEVFKKGLPALRVARFRDGIQEAAELDGLANYFQRQWISQAAIGAVVLTAHAHDEDLEQASARLISGDLPSALRRVLEIAFQVNDSNVARGNRAVREVFGVFASPQTVRAVVQQLPVLWEVPGLDWDRWLAMRIGSSFGAALTGAVAQLLPQTEAGDVVIDLEMKEHDGPPGELDLDVWLSERSIGGGGVIEKLAGQKSSDFAEAFSAQLEPSDGERCDGELSRFLGLAMDEESDVSGLVARFRAGQSHADRVSAFAELREALPAAGIAPRHAVVSAIGHRILRPGSSAKTDAFVNELHRFWVACEDRWALELDSRTAACLATRHEPIRKLAIEVFGKSEAVLDRSEFFNLVYAQYWPRGAQAASSKQGRQNEFQTLPDDDPRILRQVLASCVGRSVEAVDSPAPEISTTIVEMEPALARFFGLGNDLSFPAKAEDWHAEFIEQALSQNARFVLPRESNGELIWYAGCADDRDRRVLNEALWSFVGPSDTDFLRRESKASDGDLCEAAFADLVGARFFKFRVIGSGKDRVVWALQHLLKTL